MYSRRVSRASLWAFLCFVTFVGADVLAQTKYPNRVTLECEGNLSVIQGSGLVNARELNPDRNGFSVTIDISKNPTLEPENEPHLSVMGQDSSRANQRSQRNGYAAIPHWVYLITPVPVGATTPAICDRIELRVLVSYASNGHVNEMSVDPGSTFSLRAYDETLPADKRGELKCRFTAERD